MGSLYRGYQDLEIYKLAHQLAVEIHEMTLTELPKFEQYEEGQQIRRSSKSVVCNIVEGFSLREYPREFYRYCAQANASLDETKEHLLLLFETKSLRDKKGFDYFQGRYQELGRMIFGFMKTLVNRSRMLKKGRKE